MLARAQSSRDHRSAAATPPVDARAVAVGVAVTFLLTVAVSAVLAVVIYFTEMTEAHVAGALYYIGLVAVTFGGASASRRAGKSGLLHGALSGAAYVILSLAAGALLFPGSDVLAGALGKMVTGAAAGALGGVVGINL
ncbi:MAG TPA: TIGR04086 family membrane protein [Bacillota bacterium]